MSIEQEKIVISNCFSRALGDRALALTGLMPLPRSRAGIASAAEPTASDRNPPPRNTNFRRVEVTLKKGQPVILRLTSTDRIHGFISRALKVDTDITPGKATDIAITPAADGHIHGHLRPLLWHRPRQYEDEAHGRRVSVAPTNKRRKR